jgi:hypothetical protein
MPILRARSKSPCLFVRISLPTINSIGGVNPKRQDGASKDLNGATTSFPSNPFEGAHAMKSPSRHALAVTINIAFAAALFVSAPFATTTANAWDWGSGWGKTVSGSGNVKTENRNVANFTGIALSLGATVEVRQGNTESLTIEGDDNILPLIETVVEGASLKIRPLEKNTSFRTKNLKIIVNAKTIESLAIGGSGDIRANTLKTEKLKVSIGGAGEVRITTLDTDTLSADIAGSGDMSVGGRANTLTSSIAGSGDIKAGKLEAKTVKLSIAGSGAAAVWATEALKVSIAGSGDVKYYGDAKVSKSVAGSGSIVRVGAGPGQ